MSTNTTIALPRVHVAGSSALHHAHVEVGAHGIAVFLSPDSALPLLDIGGTREQLRELVDRLAEALRDPETAVDRTRREGWDLSS